MANSESVQKAFRMRIWTLEGLLYFVLCLETHFIMLMDEESRKRLRRKILSSWYHDQNVSQKKEINHFLYFKILVQFEKVLST